MKISMQKPAECPFQNGKEFPSFGLDGTSRGLKLQVTHSFSHQTPKPQGLRRMAMPRRGRRPPSRQARRVTRPEKANDFLHSSWGMTFPQFSIHKIQTSFINLGASVSFGLQTKFTKGYLTKFDPCPVNALHLRTSFARQRAADSSQVTLSPGIQKFSEQSEVPKTYSLESS